MNAVKSPWLIGFGVVAVLHLLLVGLDVSPLDTITKCLLAPLLAAWAWQMDGPRLLVAALLLCFLGDLLMDVGPFAAGMAAFAAAHVCFITLFAQRGAFTALKAKPLIAIVYLAAAAALIALAWGGLEPAIRAAVPIYALLLAGTAATSLALDTRAGIGAALFVVSDALIALGEAHRLNADATWHQLAVMTLYLLSILLITAGVLNREARTRRIAADGFDITQHTDCWPKLPAR